jgi:hypothetical protein
MDDATAALLCVPFVALAANRDCSRPDHYAGFRGFFVGAQPDAARLEKIAEQAARQHGRLKYKIAKVFGRDELLQAIEVNKARGIAGRLIVDFKRV